MPVSTPESTGLGGVPMTEPSMTVPWRSAPERRAPAARRKTSVMAALKARVKRLWHAAWYLGDDPADDNF